MKLLLFLKRNEKCAAIAEYDVEAGRFVVLKGSLVSDSISTAPTFKGANAVKDARLSYVKNRKVIQDVVFRSSSTAGNFVTGNSTDGPRSWKDETGKQLKVILGELKG